MEIKIVRTPIALADVALMAKDQFGIMIKASVDVNLKIMALGGELHADEEALLLENGSKQENIWGINVYPGKPPTERIEFDSMINIRPSRNNFSRGIESAPVRQAVWDAAAALIRDLR